jgi:hypothetical protein
MGISQDIINATARSWLVKAWAQGISGKLLRKKAQIHRGALFFTPEQVQSVYAVMGG